MVDTPATPPAKTAPAPDAKKVPPPLTAEEKDGDFRWTLEQIRSQPYNGHMIADAIAYLAGDKAVEPPPKEVKLPEFVMDDRGRRHQVSTAHEIRDEYGRVLKSKTLPVNRHAKWDHAVALSSPGDRGHVDPNAKVEKPAAAPAVAGNQQAPAAPKP